MTLSDILVQSSVSAMGEYLVQESVSTPTIVLHTDRAILELPGIVHPRNEM